MPHKRMMDDRFFNGCIVRDECSNLNSVHRAIEKWEDVATMEWESNQPDTTTMNDWQAHWAAEHFNDEAYMIHVTKEAMLGSLAVTVSSSVEKFFGVLCQDRGVALTDRAVWGEKRQRLEGSLGISCNDLPGIRATYKSTSTWQLL